jgi:hypothetical protein
MNIEIINNFPNVTIFLFVNKKLPDVSTNKFQHKKNSLYLDIIEREEADHSIVFSFIPILVNLASHEYYVPSSEAELPATHLQSIILLCSYCDRVH